MQSPLSAKHGHLVCVIKSKQSHAQKIAIIVTFDIVQAYERSLQSMERGKASTFIALYVEQNEN